ncbi:MAG: helix-turn-helix transcriptional regulator [Bacteroides sp.]|nr:helix-turn-helix transcriptional regulator [Bacteroides sp.]
MKWIYLLLWVVFQSAFTAHGEKTGHIDSLYAETANLDASRLLVMADSAYVAKDNSRALSLYLAICKRDEDKAVADSVRLKAFIGAGDVLMRKCHYPGALDYYVSGLMLCETDTAMQRQYAGEFYKNIGNVYSSLNDYEQGIYYYKLALDQSRPMQEGLRVRILFNLAGFSTYVGNASEARHYLDLAQTTGYKPNAVTRFLNLFLEGLVLGSEGHDREAITNLRKAEQFAKTHDISARYLCSAQQHLYDIYAKQGRTDSLFYYLKACEESAENNGILSMFPNMLSDMADYYYKNGNPGLGKEYRFRYLDLRDSLSNEREFDAIKQVQFQYEARKAANKIETLHKEKEANENLIRKQRRLLLGVVIGLLVVGGFLWIIAWQNRNLKRSYKSLYEINRDLAKKEDERKYSSSNLKEEHRSELAEKIEKLMDTAMIYCEPDFSLDMLAEHVESNTKYVSQTINAAFGKNFSSYVNDYRVRLAAERLSDKEFSNYTVTAIGESVGFKSQSSFTSVFRKATGLSPSIFRKMSIVDKNREQEI